MIDLSNDMLFRNTSEVFLAIRRYTWTSFNCRWRQSLPISWLSSCADQRVSWRRHEQIAEIQETTYNDDQNVGTRNVKPDRADVAEDQDTNALCIGLHEVVQGFGTSTAAHGAGEGLVLDTVHLQDLERNEGYDT